MSISFPSLRLILILLPILSFAQLDETAVFTQNVPDFGAVYGTWGQVQLYRPLGVKGIILEDWKDLNQLHPLYGEPYNTDRQGWLPMADTSSLWMQSHPQLTTPADTSKPALLVNYKQGAYIYKDFNVWYHNSLDSQIRYGWTSKLRSQTRALNFSSYAEQRHRLQLEADLDQQMIRVEAGYEQQVNPLYRFQLDSTGLFWNANDSIKLVSDRWEGELLYTNRDSLGSGSELFFSMQAGDWSWYQNTARSFRSLAYWSYHFRLTQAFQSELLIGYRTTQLGLDLERKPFFQMGLSRISWGKLHANLGLRYFDTWLPQIEVNYQPGALVIKYRSLQLVTENPLLRSHAADLVHLVQARFTKEHSNYLMGAWTGSSAGQNVSGYQLQMEWEFPWDMDLRLGASGVNVDSTVWLMGNRQVNWQLSQELMLLDHAMRTRFKVWGRHLFKPQSADLDAYSYETSNSTVPFGHDLLHLINYTIDIQVSSLILAFTDSNVLQDPLWTDMAAVSWDSEYAIIRDQIPELRFRYFSLVWIFDN